MLIGCYDLLRGFMHTVLLYYSATHIAVIDRQRAGSHPLTFPASTFTHVGVVSLGAVSP